VGIRALREWDAVIERWLQNYVTASYDAMKINPSPAESVDSVLDFVHGFDCAAERAHWGTISVRGYGGSDSNGEFQLMSMLKVTKWIVLGFYCGGQNWEDTLSEH